MAERENPKRRRIAMEEIRLEGETYQLALERYFTEHEVPPQIKVDPEVGTRRFFDEVEVVKAENFGGVTHSLAVAMEDSEWVFLKDGEEVFSDGRSAGIELLSVTADYSTILILDEDIYHCWKEAVMIEDDGYSSIARGKNMKFHREVSHDDLSKSVFSFNPEENGNKTKDKTTIVVYDRELDGCDTSINVEKSLIPAILAVNSDYSKIIWEGFNKEEKTIYLNGQIIASGEITDQRCSGDGEQYFVVSKGKHGVNLINYNGWVIPVENAKISHAEISADFSVGIVEVEKDRKRQILAITSLSTDYSPLYDELLDYHAHESDVTVDVRQNNIRKRFVFRSQDV